MAQADILSIIPASEYMRIKAHDTHPLFRAYVVGHEGESRGDVSVDGENFFGIVKKWYRSAIDNLHEKISYGLRLFHGHDYSGETNAQRNPIGEVVGKATKTIKGLWSEVIVAYIYPSFRNLPLDVASIEADIILSEDKGNYSADVEGVSGIALESSAIETPGFPGATVLGYCQEFARNTIHSKRRGKMNQFNFEDLTLDDIKAYVKSKNVNPTEIYSLGELTDHSEVKEVIAEAKKTARKAEYEHRKRTDDKFDKTKEEWEKEKDTILAENLKLKADLAKGGVSELFNTAKASRKLDGKEITFIEKRLTKFDLKDPEKIKEEFDSFLDQQIDDYSDALTALGLKRETAPGNGKPADETIVGPGDETKLAPGSIDDDPFIVGGGEPEE